MKNFYIYSFDYKEKKRSVSATVIFCPGMDLDAGELQQELQEYYTNYYQTEKMVVIGGNYIPELAELVISNKIKIFKDVPVLEAKSFDDNLHVLYFKENGELEEMQHAKLKQFEGFNAFKKSFLHPGLQQIFIQNEGMVEATGSHHHFVFPSGKHSDRFLRVANVLIYSSEIYFIAYGLLRFFKRDFHKVIYCDTSSINSVAIALNDLVNRFHLTEKPKIFPINSFKSYEGLYNSNLNLKSNTFVMISASTSGGMLDYFLRTHRELTKNNLVIIYFLENRKPTQATMEQVICDLTKRIQNPNGVPTFDTPDPPDCKLCKINSFAVEVSGDVFLLEKPKVNSVRINAEDMDLPTSSAFVNQFMSIGADSSILKVNYKDKIDDSPKKYELYIDYSHLMDCLEEPRLAEYKSKLNAYIDQFVPSNLKYVLYLNDLSSEKLARYILEKISGNYRDGLAPTPVSQAEFKLIKSDVPGSILIVGSCISSGKNLLYLSRALRDYQLRIVYFMGINRCTTTEAYSFLKSNLKYGTYGSENSSFVEVEKIHCSNLSIDNAWQVELDFVKKHIANEDDSVVLKFLKERQSGIDAGSMIGQRGMSNKIFLPRISEGGRQKQLKIRRNSAFYNRKDYAENVSQSDVYF